jgi:spore germination cell wall hydrolase CwlJ-like protein
VYRPHQFSWTTDETLRSSKPRGPLYVSAVYAAKTALLHEQMGLPPFSNGATHYHAKHVRPAWARSMVLVAEIGAHKFYRAS